MSTAKPRHLLRIEYKKAAEAYLRSLPPEHFMEATAQATQRTITLESLDLVHARRPAVQVFNELLVQYPGPRGTTHHVVPDNMVVVCDEPIEADLSFDIVLQPAQPLWVLDYVSQHSNRKDYEKSFRAYERDLKVPYCLLFFAEAKKLSLYRHTGRKYAPVVRGANGRLAIPELNVNVAVVESFVRFWFEGRLLQRPAELSEELDAMRKEIRQLREKTRVAKEQVKQAQRRRRRALAQLEKRAGR